MSQDPAAAAEREARLKERRAELERLLEEKAKRDGTRPVQESKDKGLNLAAASWVPPTSGGGGANPNTANTVFEEAYDDGEEFDDEDWGDDDDDFLDDEDFDADLEAFEAELSGQRPGDVWVPGQKSQAGTAPPAGAAPPVPAKPKPTFGEFELFRLAKLGDLHGFRNHEAAEGISIASLEDNNKRTAVHFAADGGNVELLKYLVDELHMPIKADEKGMSPYDIALICRHEDCSTYLLQKGMAASTGAQVAAKFAPKPPGMVASKPLVGDTVPPVSRKFWGKKQPPLLKSDTVTTTVVPPTEEFPVEDVFTAMEESSSTASGTVNHLDSWCTLMPRRFLKRMAAVTPHIGAFNPETHKVHGIMSLFLLGQVVGSSTLANPCSMVGNWHVKPAEGAGKGEVARAMLSELYELLKKESHQAVFFRSKQKLPFPSVSTMKYFRRCVQPHAIFASPVKNTVYPDYAKFDTVLRCDALLKGQLAVSDLSREWKQMDSGEIALIEQLCGFLNSQGMNQLDLYVDWESGAFGTCFDRPGVSVFYRVNASTSKISDVMVFRSRVAREDDSISVATLVLCCFTAVPSDNRLLHACHVAVDHLGSHVVYATNTYGLTDRELRISFFEEVQGAAEYIYAASSPATSLLTAGVPAAKTGLPLALV